MITTLTDDVMSPAWLDEWERLFLETPKRKWEKKELERNTDESNYKYSYRLLYSRLVGKGLREIGQNPILLELGVEWVAMMLLHSHMKDALEFAKKQGGFDLLRKYAHYSDEAFEAQIMGMCRRAARWAIRNFDADTYKTLQERGRRGGMKFKKYNLEDHMATHTLPAAQAAKVLGVSRQTVYNMRDEFKNINMETGEMDG